MPRAESGSPMSVALGQLRSQTATDGEFQRAVSFLLAKAVELSEARHGVFDPSLFRLQRSQERFKTAIGCYAAVVPCLAALGYELSDDCDEFLLPGQLTDSHDSADRTLAGVISELRASVPGTVC